VRKIRSGRIRRKIAGDLKFDFLFIFLFVFSAPYLFAGYLPGERLGILGGEKRQGQMQPQGQAEENSSSLRIPDFGPDGLKGLTEDQLRMLKADKIVMTASPEVTPDGHSVIAAAVMFKVAVEQAWEILSATDRQIEYLEEIKKLRVLEAGEDFNRTEFEVKVMGQKVRYTVVHHFLPELYYLWWELDKKAPHDLKDLSGFWRLYPAGEGKTIGRYGSRVVPGFPVPEFIRKPLFKSGVRSSLEKVRVYVEKNASFE